jgi:hypothetical protein
MGKNIFRKIQADANKMPDPELPKDGVILVDPVTPEHPLAKEFVKMDTDGQKDMLYEFTYSASEMAANRGVLKSSLFYIEKLLPRVEDAKEAVTTSLAEINTVTTSLSGAVANAKTFTFKTELTQDAITQLNGFYDEMVTTYSNKITEYGNMIDAKHKDFIKTMEQHEQKLSNILAKPSDGIWLSQGMTWLCLTLLLLLSLFFCLTIYANYAIIHSAELSKFLWTFGLSFAAIFGAVVFVRIKFS